MDVSGGQERYPVTCDTSVEPPTGFHYTAENVYPASLQTQLAGRYGCDCCRCVHSKLQA